MKANTDIASENNTVVIDAKTDDSAKLFDSLFWDNQETFPFNENQPIENDKHFVLDASKLGANEKYIRNYTLYEIGNYMCYKKGGLIIEGEFCGYEEGYIKPGDLLFYREDDSPEIKQIEFSDLLPVATQHFTIDDFHAKHFAIHFRSLTTGEFYSIKYDYPGLYETNASSCNEYPNFYARKTGSTESALLDAYNSGRYDIKLHNLRKFKIQSFFKFDEDELDKQGRNNA